MQPPSLLKMKKIIVSKKRETFASPCTNCPYCSGKEPLPEPPEIKPSNNNNTTLLFFLFFLAFFTRKKKLI